MAPRLKRADSGHSFSAFNNEFTCILPSPGLIPLGQLSPGGDGMGIALSGFSFSTPMRMIHWVHGHPPDMRPSAQPPGPSCLSDRHIFIAHIADLTDGRHAGSVYPPDLTGHEPDLDIVLLLGHELGGTPGAANQLSPLPLF